MSKTGRPTILDPSSIRLDGDTQVRCQIDEPTVSDYADAISRGDKLPPIVVYHDGSDWWLADGFHRVQAHLRTACKQIAAQVHTGTREDAAWHALGANRANGLRMSNADKERAIKRALQMRPDSSDRAIADHVGVSPSTVGRHRSGVQVGHLERSREGRDGKKYPPPPPPVVPPPPPVVPPVASMPPEVPPPPKEYDYTPPESPPPPPVLDRLGRAITNERIITAFERDDELAALYSTLKSVKSAVLKALGNNDLLYADIAAKGFEADMTNALRQIKHARPYTTCPYCGGDGCRACHGRGWCNKITYDNAPAESKDAAGAVAK